MSALHFSKYPQIKRMYEAGSTMAVIAQHFNVSLNAVVYAMRKGGIVRRSASEARQAAFAQKEASFQVKALSTKQEKQTVAIGIALYWAEGSKASGAKVVDFANSDPDMIVYFMRFLRTRYSIDEKRLRVLLYCHSDQDVQILIRFWSKVTGIPARQFSKPYVRKDFRQGGRKMNHGLIHVRYADKKLLSDILGRIQVLREMKE